MDNKFTSINITHDTAKLLAKISAETGLLRYKILETLIKVEYKKVMKNAKN